MSAAKNDKSKPSGPGDIPSPFVAPESQKQRWVKYGANVALTIVVVIVLAWGVGYLAQKYNSRVDTTQAGLYSLKPQTVNIIKGLGQKVKIVSLYAKPQQGDADPGAQDYAGVVADLLQEYQRKGKNIEVETIDPIAEGSKVDQLIEQVKEKYGGEVKLYRQFLGDFPKTLEQIKKFAEDELAKLKTLPFDDVQDQQLQETMGLTVITVQGFPQLLERTQQLIERENKQKIPNYKGAVESVRGNTESLGQMLERVIADFGKLKDDKKVPETIRGYMADSLPRYEAQKKTADEVLERIKNLGELKLDELRQSLRQYNSILVMGEKEWRVLPFNEVWRAPRNLRAVNFDTEGEQLKRQFAGEQQVSTAIVALTTEKQPKVVFVRPGGPPLASSMMSMMGRGGDAPLSDLADRLRDYNFEVLEKDLSGQWAMQSQMQGMPAMPEPSDDQIKDAVWIVLSYAPAMGQMGPNPLGSKVQGHLAGGGSALMLFTIGSDPLEAATGEWGIDVDTDAVAVHELIKTAGARSSDMIEDAQRIPFVFVGKEYGDHPLVKPLASLESLLAPMLVVKTSQAQGVKTTPLLPLPTEPKTWGERDYRDALQGQPVEFNPKDDGAGDVPGPIHAGAAAEKVDGKGARVVAIGGLEMFTNNMLSMPDRELLKRGILVARFPGNAELFTNAIYWLSRMDTMIAISPAAMEVSRIEPMSRATLLTWRVGVLVVGLPLLVLLLGAGVYVRRRD
ncbi:MAG: DUF7088 domain-containing protein [Tepidisphaeraceae bacterium]